MTDTLGLLDLPVGSIADDASKNAFGDPLLQVTLEFVQAVVNAKARDAWKKVSAFPTAGTSVPLPISYVFPHDPSAQSFNKNVLPALFAWRITPHAAKTTRTQDWLIRESTIALLWVPPPTTQDKSRVREPFRNAVAAAIDFAFHRGRDAAWKVTDDTYYDAQTYGSTYRRQAGLMWHQLRQIDPHPIQVQYDDGPAETISGIMGQLDVREVLEWGADAFQALDHIEGTIANRTLSVNAFDYKIQIASVSPATGAHAGGTTLTVRGKQFTDTPTLTIAGVACTDVTLVDETTLTAVTPAHTVGGPFDLVVTNPSTDSATLSGAFTFT